MNNLIVFVILHYNTIKETEDCVRSIEDNIDINNFSIVIVDNGSPNGSGEELKKIYHKKEHVVVIINKENLGFAQGNNVGVNYATHKLGAKFICVLNNDTLIIQKNFFDNIQKEYQKSQFALLGPKIKLKDGTDNYLYHKLPQVQFFLKELDCLERELWRRKWKVNYLTTSFNLVKKYILKMLGRKEKNKISYEEFHIYNLVNTRVENVILHGCCIIFSEKYFKEYQEAFDPRTFMFREEELLFLRCQRKNLRIVYNPQIEIKHLEDVATNSILKKKNEKIDFKLRNQIESLKILIKEMQEAESSGFDNNTNVQ